MGILDGYGVLVTGGGTGIGRVERRQLRLERAADWLGLVSNPMDSVAGGRGNGFKGFGEGKVRHSVTKIERHIRPIRLE